MTLPTKQSCDNCGRVFSKRSLENWKGIMYCGKCKKHLPSWKIMYPNTPRTKEEIEEMEGRG